MPFDDARQAMETRRRATAAYNAIMGASYYGSAFRLLLQDRPAALAAAESLANFLTVAPGSMGDAAREGARPGSTVGRSMGER